MRETQILQKLGPTSNVVQLVGHQLVSFKGRDWQAVLIRPYGRLLATTDPVHLYKQAAFDITAAIGGSFAKGICHQDVSPFNMVVYQNRVFLTDWSAGKVSSGRQSPEDLGHLTMTPLFAAISARLPAQHQQSFGVIVLLTLLCSIRLQAA